jgi:hypothetical protein
MTELCCCSSVKREGGAEQVIDLLHALGGEFWTVGIKRVLPDPLSQVRPDGDLSGLTFQHRLLAQDLTSRSKLHADKLPESTSPWAGFSFRQENRRVRVSQAAWGQARERIDQIALGQRSLARLLYPHLHPRYGSIDEFGINIPTPNCDQAPELPYLYWTNIFGPDYVAEFGEDFLLSAPGWSSERLDDGGILYTTTESYIDWFNTEGDEFIEYFGCKAPIIEIYRAEPMP